MNVIALKVRFEQHDRAIAHGAICEVIDQKIDAHTWRRSEYGCQTEADRISPVQNCLLDLNLIAPVTRNRAHRCLFSAISSGLSDTVAAVGNRHQDSLLARKFPEHRNYSVPIDFSGSY